MKNIVVIGGSSGIGRAITQQQANEGNQVWSTYRNSQATSGSNITNIELDVLNSSDYSWLPETIDALIYCPGAIDLKPFHRIKSSEFIEDFQLQVVGAIDAIQAALPKLKKGNSPSITLFSTVAVQGGFAFHAKVAASKGAIEGLTRSLSAELAPSIRVNAIAPSLTNTPLAGKLLSSEDKVAAHGERHPLKRVGTPNDLAQTVDFLINQTWMTGQILHVDGGMSVIK